MNEVSNSNGTNFVLFDMKVDSIPAADVGLEPQQYSLQADIQVLVTATDSHGPFLVLRLHNSFDMSAFDNYDAASPLLHRFVDRFTDSSVDFSVLYSDIVDCLFHAVIRFANNDHDGRVCLFADILIDFDPRLSQYDVERALAESAAEAGNGMVPASEEAVKKMLHTARVGSENESSCSICLEEMEAGSAAASMPCAHEFHEECIVRWLKESHLCPLCRFQMPTSIC